MVAVLPGGCGRVANLRKSKKTMRKIKKTKGSRPMKRRGDILAGLALAGWTS